MNRPMKRATMLAGIATAGAAGVLGIVLAGPALAETPSASPSAATTTDSREAKRAEKQEELAAALAAELGIDKSKVAAALTKVQAAQQAEFKADRAAELKTRLDAAVKAGTLTQEQADAIQKASEAGVLPHGGGHGKGGGRGPR